MMSQVSLLLPFLLCICIKAQHVDHPDGSSDHFHQQDDDGNFNFGYDVARSDGSRDTRRERGDIYGNVVGSYSLVDVDGRSRTVDYTAGEEGFKAVVRTNEPGTANQSPAFVTINAAPPRVQGGVRQPAPVNPPVTTGRRPYTRPPVHRHRPSYEYNPHYHRQPAYAHGDHSHTHYNYEYPYYNY